ncbi:hypothetical protein GCM10027038_46260 [Arthrobacter bambusae]
MECACGGTVWSVMGALVMGILRGVLLGVRILPSGLFLRALRPDGGWWVPPSSDALRGSA